jgi:hypothetical protein
VELLSNALSEVKTKAHEESDAQLEILRRSMRSFHASEVSRMKDEKKKDVTRVLAPYVGVSE